MAASAGTAYRPRIADAELRMCLAAAGAVVIEEPKACGMTRMAQQLAASTVLLDVDTAARQALAVDPALVLAGPRPRLLDEWQVVPSLWNQVRRAVDAAAQPGQFLLTGSAVPADEANRHTGAGRFSFLRLRPMTLAESGAGQGGVSLAALLAGTPPSCGDPGLAVADLAELVCRGGWPAQVDRPLAAACRANRDNLEQVRQVDVATLAASFALQGCPAPGSTTWSGWGCCSNRWWYGTCACWPRRLTARCFTTATTTAWRWTPACGCAMVAGEQSTSSWVPHRWTLPPHRRGAGVRHGALS